MRHLSRKLMAGAAVGAAVSLAAAAAPAQASLLQIIGGTAGKIPQSSTDEVLPVFGIPVTGPAYGYFGAQIGGPAGHYKIEVFGAEAAFLNNFEAPAGNVLYTHPGGTVIFDPPLVFWVDLTAPGGLIDFAFSVNGVLGALPNGSNPAEPGPLPGVPTFFASCDLNTDNGPRNCNSITLHLDDAGGGDDDHDDLVIRISVPEPMSLALFGLGLAGFGLARRRRSQG